MSMVLVSGVLLFIGNMSGWSFFQILLSRNLSKVLLCGSWQSNGPFQI